MLVRVRVHVLRWSHNGSRMVTFSDERARCEAILERAQAALKTTHAKAEKVLAKVYERAQADLAIVHDEAKKALAEFYGRT